MADETDETVDETTDETDETTDETTEDSTDETDDAADELTERVLRKLRITWEDDDTAARVSDIMDVAAVELIERLGLSTDYPFTDAGPEQALFLALCFYSWNDAEDEFYINYARDIAQCRHKWEVMQYAQETELDSELS